MYIDGNCLNSIEKHIITNFKRNAIEYLERSIRKFKPNHNGYYEILPYKHNIARLETYQVLLTAVKDIL